MIFLYSELLFLNDYALLQILILHTIVPAPKVWEMQR